MSGRSAARRGERKASFLRALPHVIHPTEVQLVRVEEDGALGLYVYDLLSGAVVKTASVGSTAQSIAVTPDGGFLFVLEDTLLAVSNRRADALNRTMRGRPSRSVGPGA